MTNDPSRCSPPDGGEVRCGAKWRRVFPHEKIPVLLFLGLALAPVVRAEFKRPAIISERMVLQQKRANRICDGDTSGTKITVTFAGRTHTGDSVSDG